MAANCLGLGTLDGTKISKVDGVALGGGVSVDDAKAGFVFYYVVLQGVKKPFCVLRSHKDAADNLRLGEAGKHGCKVNDELAVGVGNKGKVGVLSSGHFLAYIKAELLLIVVHIKDSYVSSANLANIFVIL